MRSKIRPAGKARGQNNDCSVLTLWLKEHYIDHIKFQNNDCSVLTKEIAKKKLKDIPFQNNDCSVLTLIK